MIWRAICARAFLEGDAGAAVPLGAAARELVGPDQQADGVEERGAEARGAGRVLAVRPAGPRWIGRQPVLGSKLIACRDLQVEIIIN